MRLNYKNCIDYIKKSNEQKTIKSFYYFKILLFIFVIVYSNDVIVQKFSATAQEVTLSTKINMCDTSNRLQKVYISDTENA